jgi:hypothetical protein
MKSTSNDTVFATTERVSWAKFLRCTLPIPNVLLIYMTPRCKHAITNKKKLVRTLASFRCRDKAGKDGLINEG